MSKAGIKLEIDAKTVLKSHHLEKGGMGSLFLAKEVARKCDPYVPFLSGDLKNHHIIRPGSVTYIMPYAKKQYYENKGRGKRGKQWDVRMMADRGGEIVRALKSYIGR